LGEHIIEEVHYQSDPCEYLGASLDLFSIFARHGLQKMCDNGRIAGHISWWNHPAVYCTLAVPESLFAFLLSAYGWTTSSGKYAEYQIWMNERMNEHNDYMVKLCAAKALKYCLYFGRKTSDAEQYGA
jgi:hypothetical protein